MLGDGAILWNSKKQASLASFTKEANYMAISQWLKKFISDVGLE